MPRSFRCQPKVPQEFASTLLGLMSWNITVKLEKCISISNIHSFANIIYSSILSTNLHNLQSKGMCKDLYFEGKNFYGPLELDVTDALPMFNVYFNGLTQEAHGGD